MDNPLISVIIPAYNSHETIKDTMKGATKLSASFDFEIIVIDSSPNEDTANIIHQFPNANLIRSKNKLTPGQARNAGVIDAKGTFLAFTDSDTEIPPDWLTKIKDAIDKGHDFIAGSIGNSPRNDNFFSRAEYYFEFNEHSPYRPAGEVQFAGSCNFICRKDMFEKAGGFPEHRGAEDVILSRKIRELGIKTYFHPEIVIYHRNRRTAKKVRISSVILGKYNGLFRKMGLLPNFNIINNPLVCWFFVPLFVAYKTARIIYRVMNTKDPRKWEFIRTFPVYFFIIFYWTVGFYIGAYSKKIDITK
ncbi:MAG: glycosyltransferase [candidate division Zixibacteria bacterium]|nr:glycosyltransferase [candidate division Zixibacteria bacterium]